MQQVYTLYTWEGDQEIDDSFIKKRSNVARMRQRIETITSAIIEDLEDGREDSKGPHEKGNDLSNSGDSDGEVSSTSSVMDRGLIQDWIMNFDTCANLRTKMPRWSGSYKVILDLEDGNIYVRVVPGNLHAAASRAFNYAMGQRSTTGGRSQPFRISCDAGRSSRLFLSLIQLDYRYNGRSSKSPETVTFPGMFRFLLRS